jgi:hypothetical protein
MMDGLTVQGSLWLLKFKQLEARGDLSALGLAEIM